MQETVLEHSRSTGQGAFVLPQFHADIPLEFNPSHARMKALAQFALASDRCGIPLPGGDFDSIENVLARQWTSYLDKTLGEQTKKLINCHPEMVVSESQFEVRMRATNRLNIFRVKPVVERLEAKHPGLGWFVYDLVRQANQHGMNIYDPTIIGQMGAMQCNESETDEEFARQILEESGNEADDDEITQEQINDLRDSYSAFWPSDLLSAVEGHRHLLGWSEHKLDRSLRHTILKRRKVLSLMKSIELPAKLKACVEDALALQAMFMTDKLRVFDNYSQSEYFETDYIGAACIVVWNETSVLLELIQHHEIGIIEGGEQAEQIGMASISSTAAIAEFNNLARETRAYFDRWNLLGKLLSHFPTVD